MFEWFVPLFVRLKEIAIQALMIAIIVAIIGAFAVSWMLQHPIIK